MGRLAIALVAATVLAIRAAGAAGDGDPAPLNAVGDGLAALRASFSEADGKVRLVVVTSEVDATARNALRAIRHFVLGELSSPDIAVLAVWVPEIHGEDADKSARESAREAERLADPRLSSFWAADSGQLDPWRASLGACASIPLLEMPRAPLVAIYSPGAKWGELPPVPVYWSHQEKALKKRQRGLDLLDLRRVVDEQLVKDPEDVADVSTETRRAGGDKGKLYLLHGPIGAGAPPANGSPLLVVLPGGEGGTDFRAFVKRIGKQGAGTGWLVAQLVSKKWTAGQTTIWPTEKSKVTGQEFTTEEFIDAVLAEVCAQRKIDRERIVILAWSSGGPAIYAHALRAKPGKGAIPVTRYFVSQSVYRPEWHPPVEGAKGKRFFLHHSREDETCKFEDAERAREQLGRAGAAVELLEYPGGHGWHGDMVDQIRRGLRWLTEG